MHVAKNAWCADGDGVLKYLLESDESGGVYGLLELGPVS